MKRLCELVDIVVNNENCVVFKVKDDTCLDLIAWGCFKGTEDMIRLTKGRTPEITVFNKDGSNYSYHFGEGSTTVISENMKQQREIIRQCAILDFGIVCDWSYGRNDVDWAALVAETSKIRKLEDAVRNISIVSGGGMVGNVRVNEQTLVLDVHVDNLLNGLKNKGYSVTFDRDISKGLPCGEVRGYAEPIEDMSKTLEVGSFDYNNGEFKVRMAEGYLVANVCPDPNFPGIDIEYIPDNEERLDLNPMTRYRVLVEQPEKNDVRVLVWDDNTNEDYTREIIFEGTEVNGLDKVLSDASERSALTDKGSTDKEVDVVKD